MQKLLKISSPNHKRFSKSFRRTIVLLLIFYSFSISAEIYKCTDENGKVIFSDRKECENPDEIKLPEEKHQAGKKSPEKITLRNVEELRESPRAVKLSFSNELKYAVSGYYEGFYIVHSDHVSIFIDKAVITKTGYGSLEEANLESIRFALITSTRFGFDKDDWIYSDKYEISHNLKDHERVVYQNISFEIWTVGYDLDELSKYKFAGIVRFDKNHSVPILSNDFIKVDADNQQNDSASNQTLMNGTAKIDFP